MIEYIITVVHELSSFKTEHERTCQPGRLRGKGGKRAKKEGASWLRDMIFERLN
jgi:hypothetical protein